MSRKGEYEWKGEMERGKATRDVDSSKKRINWLLNEWKLLMAVMIMVVRFKIMYIKVNNIDRVTRSNYFTSLL